MISIFIDLMLATLCVTGAPTADQCYNVLVGESTPRGEFTLIQRLTDDPGYGGDVLQFKETESGVFAIHRPWLLRPKEDRLKRLASPKSKDRTGITGGCVNVPDAVYTILLEYAPTARLVIK